MASGTKSRIGVQSREPDQYPDQCVIGRPLEAYGPNILDRHIFWEFVPSLIYEH